MGRIIIVIISVCVANLCLAQDPHFSQYYASPSTVNPATTGFFHGDLRLTSLYRQQWPEFGEPFVSGTVSFELKPGKYKLETTKDRMAIGGMLLFDRTPDAILKSQYVYFSLGYHKALDEEGHHRLGAGFMAGYNQRYLDGSQLTFSDEFQSGGFQRGTGSEFIPSKSVNGFDLHSGIMYSYEDELKTIYSGASVYHLAAPKNYFLESNAILETIPKRWTLNTGINLRTPNLQYAASLLLMRQARINEVLVGGAVGVPLALEKGIFYIGSWYRFGEAIIPTINLQWQKINLGFSYDVVVSQKTMTRPRTVELSFTLRAARYRDYKTGCFSF
jgi:type IX secretion system PorP/SprF family membrane protein